MDISQSSFKNWDSQVCKGVPDSDAFHSKNSRYLQHFTWRTVPAIDLAFVEVYFASRAVSEIVKLYFEVPSCVEVGSPQ